MPKYGRGLNREIVASVNSGSLQEPLTVDKIRKWLGNQKWGAKVPEKYTAVCLTNASSTEHSPGFKKYFEKIREGEYRVKTEFKNSKWV